jgi:serine/threonine-protein kinase
MRSTSTADAGLDTPLGRYRLIALLGQGGMADVYLAATHGAGGFQKLLVVKLARFTGDPTFSTMFLDEARLAAQLSHPNVVQTYEIGEEGSRHYIVMEYLDGGTLARLRQKASKVGGIPLRSHLSILLQVLEGLEYAHEARGIGGKLLGVVHRDLSPTNILVTAQGVVKILDFGIAKAADSQSFTQTGKFGGKLAYMPPEQMKGERVDVRADIFAAGVMLAESALGEKLWGVATGPVIASQLANGQIPSLDRGKEIDPELKRICEKALAADRENRYATALELKQDLAKFLGTLGGPVPPSELGAFVKITIAADRTKLQEVVDAQLARISGVSLAQPPPPDLPTVDHTPSGPGDRTVKNEVAGEDSGQVEIIHSEQAVARPVASGARSNAVLVAAVIGGIAAVATILFFVMRNPEPARTAQPSQPSQPMTLAPTPPSQPATARLDVSVSPASAKVVLDGKELGAPPFVGTFPRDTQSHELVVSAAGYRSLTQRFAFDRDLDFRLSLEKEEGAVPVMPTVAAVAPPSSPPIAPSKKRPVRLTTMPTKTPATPTPAVTAPAAAKPVAKDASKRKIDGDLFDTKKTKRSLDPNVVDDGAAKPKATIDRENPWKN